MKGSKIKKLREFYHDRLVNDCVPFWLRHSIDEKEGGYITYVDRKGELYSTEKPVWFQGRGLWTYSKLINDGVKVQGLADAAKTGCEFLMEHCYDSDGRMFFLVTREGKPLLKRRYFFSETFAAIGLSEYAKASGDTQAREKARQTYDLIIDLYRDPTKLVPKYIPETLQMKGLAPPMIILATSQSMRGSDPERTALYDSVAEETMEELFRDFMKHDVHAMLENVDVSGKRMDSPRGRLVNPGHSIEASWFLMSEGMYRNDRAVIDKALTILDWSMELGWDKEYGGIMHFVDIEGKPTEQLEWDMKLWWPHTETLYALMLAYHLTGDKKYSKLFGIVHDYSFENFPDEEYGEWYGYLHRDGSVSKTFKGSVFKGPFHLPRALHLMTGLLDTMTERQEL